jgi:hypothetical protein
VHGARGVGHGVEKHGTKDGELGNSLLVF